MVVADAVDDKQCGEEEGAAAKLQKKVAEEAAFSADKLQKKVVEEEADNDDLQKEEEENGEADDDNLQKEEEEGANDDKLQKNVVVVAAAVLAPAALWKEEGVAGKKLHEAAAAAKINSKGRIVGEKTA